MISRFFIDRPIFATVLSIIITLAGIAALFNLSVAQYPDIAPPTVTISATYPGASAEVLQQTVAAPIEDEINGVENMLYMSSSSSSSGSVSFTVTFETGTDPDQATINVNNRVQQVLAKMPQEVKNQGLSVRKSASTMLMILALTSPDDSYEQLDLNNYATINIIDALKRINGVGNADVMGGGDYSMRIWIKPDRLKEFNLTTTDISKVLEKQNAQFTAGKVGQRPNKKATQFTYTVTTKGRLTEVSEFENIIVKANPDGSILRLKDIATVELGSSSYDMVSKHNGKTAVGIGIYQQPGANALDVATAVKTTMEELSESFPEGIKYSISVDNTTYVRESIKEVIKTLLIAMLLVFLVVYVFLQNWRATLIPCLAVPVSLIGAFAGMYLLGFSINTLTLLGLILAIGIVVDDAIVVLENTERIMSEEGLHPKDAAKKAMDEVSGPVIAIVLVLCAVFVPVGFLGGMTGVLYKQFAITIAISVAISGFVALTLSPALCAILLKPSHKMHHGFFRIFNAGFEWVRKRYTAGVAFAMKRAILSLLIIVIMICVTYKLFQSIPTSFIPAEDQGMFIGSITLPDAASLDRTIDLSDKVVVQALKNPLIKSSMTINGMDMLAGGQSTYGATAMFELKPWDERKSADAALDKQIMRFMMESSAFKEGKIIAFSPSGIIGLGMTGGFDLYVQNRGDGDAKELAEVSQKLAAAASKRSELSTVSTTYRADVPQLFMDVDREKAMAYGVEVGDIFDAMQSTFGALYVNDFNRSGRTFKVQIQAEDEYRSEPGDIGKIYVRSNTTNGMIPLSSLVTVQYITGPEQITRFNLFPSAYVTGTAASGYSSGEAMEAMVEVAKEVLPSDYGYEWSGMSYQEKRAGSTSTVAFAFGIVMVFLILAALYEKWSLPFSVIMVVPFGLFGAMLTLWLRGLTNDIYFQISLLVLIGLSAKNAILIVEFASLKHKEGMSVFDAAIEAARLRLRPILMTSIAFILGTLPLAVATGAGSAARHSIGTGIVGGMLSATFIAVFFVPLFFKLVTRDKKIKSKKELLEEA
ncbi:MAG: multidrug efflux RND transporter permease subunit [Deltaproteobacteria bacterium]|nr:multidrug efflux RND transporter permease subunit [Deltaproteobacteria bacterium]